MPRDPIAPSHDPVYQLEQLFRRHPVWCDAARHLDDAAESDVRFTTRPGAVWHLGRSGGETRLLPGPSRDPDFAFCFTPGSVVSLAEATGDVGDVAVRLFYLIVEGGSDTGVELRVRAPFARLVRRGYLSLLAAGGLRVLAFGAAHGVRSVRELRRLVERVRKEGDDGAPDEKPDDPGLRLRLRRATRDIGAQHDRMRELAAEVRAALAAGDGSAARTAMQRYRDALQAHFALEEDVYFPALHGLEPKLGDTIGELQSDHERLFDAADALAVPDADPADVEWDAGFLELRRALQLHEAREEALLSGVAASSR